MATVVTAVALTLLIGHAIASVQQQTPKHCFNYLNEATDRLAADLYKTADMDHTILTAMASLIAVETEISDESLCAIMNSFATNISYVDYVEILRPDNTMLDADGTVRDVSGALDFAQEAQKGDYISAIDSSSKDPNARIIRNAVPVQKGGQTIYMLYGVLRLDELAENYTTNIYDGNAYVYLVDGNTGGDEFVAIIENMEEDACKARAEQMNEQLFKDGYSVAYGVATPQNATDLSEITHLADERMMENKTHYYSKHNRRIR